MADLSMKFNTLREIVTYSQKEYATKTVFRIKEKQNKTVNYNDVTYKKMGEDVKALSTFLLEKGLSGKRIVLVGENCYEWILGYLATICLGGVFVPLDKKLPSDELDRLIHRSEPECIIYGKKFSENVKKHNIAHTICMEDELWECVKEGEALISEGNDSFDRVEIDKDEMAVLLFTSGTTDKAKAVMLSQYNIACNIYDLVLAEKFYDDDINLALLPFHHIFGLVAITLFIRLGIMNVFCEGLRFAKALKEYKVSVLVSVPLILEAVHKQINLTVKRQGKEKTLRFGLKFTAFLRKFGIDLRKKMFTSIHKELGGNLRFIICGGAALRGDLAKWFNDIGILTVQGYGLSETAPVLAAENEIHHKYGSIGFPMNGVDIKIDNPDSDGIGEIIAKGDNVMLGYWNEPEMTAEVMKDGYFHTGDMGYIDDEGYIFITGRKKDVIVFSNGKNIFPNELEQLVGAHLYVAECLVFEDTPDNLAVNVVYDEAMAKSMSQDEIYATIKKDIQLINEKLANYKRIKTVYASAQPMIKTSTSKIKRLPSIEKIKKEQKAI